MESTARSPEGDAALVGRAREGDRSALDELVRRHHAAVYRLALSILKDPDQAADAAQDAFLKALRALDSYRGDAPFRSWILTIGANEARGQLRRTDRRRETPLEVVAPPVGEGAGADELTARRDQVARIRAQIDELPEKQRLAVTLRVFEGLSFREVGEVIGSSEGAARVNYHHGIGKLRDFFAARTEDG